MRRDLWPTDNFWRGDSEAKKMGLMFRLLDECFWEDGTTHTFGALRDALAGACGLEPRTVGDWLMKLRRQEKLEIRGHAGSYNRLVRLGPKAELIA